MTPVEFKLSMSHIETQANGDAFELKVETRDEIYEGAMLKVLAQGETEVLVIEGNTEGDRVLIPASEIITITYVPMG